MPPSSPALISPYVGGKSGAPYELQTPDGRWLSRVCDRPHHYDVIVEPFAGSGAVTWQHSHGITNAIAADVDPGVQAVWECWDLPITHNIVDAPKYVIEQMEVFKGKIARDPQKGFEFLKKKYERYGEVYSERSDTIRIQMAAVSLTLRRLVFGGTLRTAKTTKKLNVALSKSSSAKTGSKLDRYLAGWRYVWPDNGIQQLTFKHDWEGAVQALANSDYENALVVIDPPYYSPKEWIEERKDGRKVQSRMTAAYPGHDPQSVDELAMCIDCLDAVLATGKAGRVVVFNYWSEELDEQIFSLATKKHWDWDRNCYTSNLGPLGGMNNAQKFHARDVEMAWEIGGKRMFQDYDAVQQCELLEVSQ